MRFFITGGAGFIGSHLSEYVLQQGNSVAILDNLSTGRLENIEHLIKHPQFSYTIDTVLNESIVEKMVQECDIIIHFAATVGVQLVVEHPVQTIHNNIDGTEIVLKYANKYHKKILLASTSEVYGKSNKIPFQEDDDLIIGNSTISRWSYACSKAMDEFLALSYAKELGLSAIVCRFFNTVGPRQTGRYGMVIPRFISQALKNEPITVFGDGLQSRCFTYVTEVCHVVYDLCQHEEALGQIFNIGSTQEISILDLARLIIEKVGNKNDIAFIPYTQAYAPGFEDMERRVPDVQKIHKLLGYAPSMSISEIIGHILKA